MGWTKRDIIKQAFREIGVTDYLFDLETDDIRAALRELDTMVAEWDISNLTYPQPTSPGDSDIDADSTLASYAIPAAYAGLAVRLAPDYGKQVSAETKAMARDGLTKVRQKTSTWPVRLADGHYLPSGAGHKDTENITISIDGTA